MKEDHSLSRLLYQHYLSDTFPIIFLFLINLKENQPVTTNLSVVAAFHYKETLHLKQSFCAKIFPSHVQYLKAGKEEEEESFKRLNYKTDGEKYGHLVLQIFSLMAPGL